jgi:hypothetical protein
MYEKLCQAQVALYIEFEIFIFLANTGQLRGEFGQFGEVVGTTLLSW